MNLDWQIFLEQHHAHVGLGYVQHFGDLTAELGAIQNGNVLCDLSQFGTLKVSGDDAQNFLQNLLSSDVQEITLQQAQLSSLNTPKGRMLASFFIWRTASAYFLQLPTPLCSAIQKRLSMYILRSKVKVEDVSTHHVVLGLAGKHAADFLQHNFGATPKKIGTVVHLEHASLIQVGTQRFQICIAATEAAALWQKLSADATPAGSPCWDWLNIRDGIPVIVPATQEQFVPQMVNLELLEGVSFKKGCYPGQEIVARMQYLGKLKRRMYLAHIPQKHLKDGNFPRAGDELFSEDLENQASGMIVNAALAPNGGCDLLAVIQITSHDEHTIHHHSIQGPALEFLPAPYSLAPTAN